MDSLPVELLCNIIDRITKQSDLKSLCEVSKGFNTCATPFLYNSITLNAAESDLGFLDVKSFSEGLLPPSQSRLRHVKHLHIVSPFHKRLRDRCIHWNNNSESSESEYEESEDGESKDGKSEDGDDENRSKELEKSTHWELERSLMSVLQQLEEDTLLSFRFVNHQRRIVSILI
ncbi:hypothetical protein MMC17_003918 [Xylographa soralifera]|nr:hypothetical protein [Xylographa soralifera]